MGFSQEALNRIEEEVLWQSKKYFLVFPWSFTNYKITPDRVFVKRGLLNTSLDETRLYRVMDIKLTQNIIQKLCGTSTIILSTRDRDMPTLLIENVMQGEDVKELLSGLVEDARKKNRVITTEGGFY